MTSPWQVPVRALRTGAVRHEHRAGRLGPLVVAGTSVAPDAEVDADATLVAVDGGIEVSSRVTAPWRGSCRRCGRPVSGTLAADVRELYRPRTERDRDGEEDEETYELGIDHLDLAPLARDAVLLDLPIAPLCREDCAGLCDRCGVDRNDTACSCGEAPRDDRWAVLDVLREDPGAAPPPAAS